MSEPVRERADQLQGTGPLLPLEARLLEGPHEACHVGVALRVRVTGARLMDLQGRTGRHEGRRGRLTTVVTHPRHPLAKFLE